MINGNEFSEEEVLEALKHYLPSQAPLKDFVHHNTLHAFQEMKFAKAIRHASKLFGYKTSLDINEYRMLHKQGKINIVILDQLIEEYSGEVSHVEWKKRLLTKTYDITLTKRIGKLRNLWKSEYQIDLDTIVHTNIFRILNSYLDQGVAITKFPVIGDSFLASLRELESNSFVSFFKSKRGKSLLFDDKVTLTNLLKILVGEEKYYSQYLFDQQFVHPGWSGMVAVLEDQPQSLLDHRNITLHDFIFMECLLEIDNLDNTLGKWSPLSEKITDEAQDIFRKEELTELDEVLNLWQTAYEWTYYDNILGALQLQKGSTNGQDNAPSFQAFFCIDDRECSIRRYIESQDSKCKTYGTPGHFAIDIYYQPEKGKYYTKVCPAPITPKHLIKEVTTDKVKSKDIHFSKYTHGLFVGWIISQSLGFWSAIKLMLNIFRPSLSPASSSSFRHMEEFSTLTVENRSKSHSVDGLQIGYTVEEMTDRVEAVLRSTGAITNFSSLVYILGHGASSANNTHYAGYDCGACSGRPGSVNARAFCYMANSRSVRQQLVTRGIIIPEETEFLGGLHDTTRDEFVFFDEGLLSPPNSRAHRLNQFVFMKALHLNAKERSRRFMSINTLKNPAKIHKAVIDRSVSLFEPRPELNHATNSICVVGGRAMTKNLFLDRRAFLNSYDYRQDPDGTFLEGILNAATPVCGGINLEYYFSRVDNEKLGAGTKLPHNVMGLIGVANGFEGDLRTGLPSQMIEVHDPIRLIMIVEHLPEVVLETIKRNSSTYQWFENEWVVLALKHPESYEIFIFKDGEFIPYEPLHLIIGKVTDLNLVVESSEENLPVFQLD